LLDIGDGVKFDSHPEISAPDAWSKEFLKQKINEARALGLEVIPKLNFSCMHHTWLKKYRYMVSTPEYYAACADVIREVCEAFGNPRFIHLGLDEERVGITTFREFIHVRNATLWWHDAYFFFKEAEKNGARPWVWSDYYWNNPELFTERMPREVLQSNWCYSRMHGNYAPNIKNRDCDLLIAIGMRFDDRVTGDPSKFGINAKIIHLEIAPAEINKLVYADVAVLGDVKQSLPMLTEKITPQDHTSWLEEFRACYNIEREDIIEPAIERKGAHLRMGEVVDAVAQQFDDAILVTDVGQQQMFASRYFRFKQSRSIITSGGLGTMGFGLPAAIGAKIGAPHRDVCLFVGDGGLQMTLQELGTIFQSEVGVKIILMNNGYLGMVRQWQELFYDKRYSFTELTNPDFELIAKANHISYRCIEKHSELDEAVKQMHESEGAFLLEVRVEREENVFPMVPAGQPVENIRLE
jgi:hypothetical protein